MAKPSDGITRWTFPIDSIEQINRLRAVDPKKVAELAESIREIGLMNRPAVRVIDSMMIDGEEVLGVPVLVHGAHRLAALQLLGNKFVTCDVVKVDDRQAAMMEIAENLHRAELTALERAEHVARYIALSKVQSAHVAPIESKRADGKGHRSEGGINAAAKELDIDRTDAQRSVKVAALSDEAKAAARELGIDNNRSALLEAARADTPADQVAVIKAKAGKPSPRPKKHRPDAEAEAALAAEFAALIPAEDRAVLATYLETIPVKALIAALRAK